MKRSPLFFIHLFNIFICISSNHNGARVPQILKASVNPIILDLKKINKFKNETITNGRVRSKLSIFQSILGIIPNQPFEFKFDQWKQLRQCGLFYNLTASTYNSPVDGGVVIAISGYELPSITFSPEITVGASLIRPEVSGGVILYYLHINL